MTQAGQRPTAAGKEDHVEVDGFRIRYWASGPPRPVRVVVMLQGMTWGLSGRYAGGNGQAAVRPSREGPGLTAR